MKRITKDSFISFLVAEVPKFDALFLKDYKPKTWYLMPLRRDVRLLPNRMRKDWLVYNGYIKSRRASTRKVWRELNVTDLVKRLRQILYGFAIPKKFSGGKEFTCELKVSDWLHGGSIIHLLDFNPVNSKGMRHAAHLVT